MRPIVLGLILTGVIVATASIIAAGSGLFIDILFDLLLSPVTRMIAVILVIFAGFAYVTGTIGFGGGAAEEPAPVADRPTPKGFKLSPAADAASRRVRTALLRLSNMPADVMTPEIQVEYDAIRSRHVPNLEAAHAKARQTVFDANDAAALDADFAASLTLIANKLHGLIDDCEEIAGRDLAVQSRFIETRHPPENSGAI